MRARRRVSGQKARAAFPAGTVLHNPVTLETLRIVEHTPERAVGEVLVAPAGAVAGPHRHPSQFERFDVLQGTMRYRKGDAYGVLGAGESATVPAGVVHDWCNPGPERLLVRITVTPPRSFLAMIGSVWGLAALGRTDAKGMPELLDAALQAEAFGSEIIFERPPAAVQRGLAATIGPLARRRGRSVTSDDVLGAAIVPPERWPRTMESDDRRAPVG